MTKTNYTRLKHRALSLLKGWGLRRFRLVRFALRVMSPGKAMVDGHTMYLDKYDSVVSRDLAKGEYEPAETQLMNSLVMPGMTVLDIGANIGYYTLQFARRVGERGEVHAFEPAPRTMALLKKNIAANGYTNVVLHEYAVGADEGNATLYLNAYNAGDNRLYASENMEEVTVSVQTIDTVLGDKRVDFIKMDIQGYEWHALQGMQALIRRTHPMIVLELSPMSLRKSGAGSMDLLGFLASHGYSFQEISEIDGRILNTSLEELLTKYPDSEERFTNILCTAS